MHAKSLTLLVLVLLPRERSRSDKKPSTSSFHGKEVVLPVEGGDVPARPQKARAEKNPQWTSPPSPTLLADLHQQLRKKYSKKGARRVVRTSQEVVLYSTKEFLVHLKKWARPGASGLVPRPSQKVGPVSAHRGAARSATAAERTYCLALLVLCTGRWRCRRAPPPLSW